MTKQKEFTVNLTGEEGWEIGFKAACEGLNAAQENYLNLHLSTYANRIVRELREWNTDLEERYAPIDPPKRCAE